MAAYSVKIHLGGLFRQLDSNRKPKLWRNEYSTKGRVKLNSVNAQCETFTLDKIQLGNCLLYKLARFLAIIYE